MAGGVCEPVAWDLGENGASGSTDVEVTSHSVV
jgi:hypothetical protein